MTDKFKCHRYIPLNERFWFNVKKSSGCWCWLGFLNKDGYGQISRNTQRVLVHRLSWEIHGLPPRGDLFVLHKCNNRKCVRPDHLYLGTRKDNMQDCVRSGNIAKKLTKEKAAEIKYSKEPYKVLTNRFRVHRSTVIKIKAGLIWCQI